MTEKTWGNVVSGDLYGTGTGIPADIANTWISDPFKPNEFDWEEAKKELQRRRLQEIINQGAPWNKVINTLPEPPDPPKMRTRTLKFKDVTFVVVLLDETMEFFEDDKTITRDELRLVQVTYPMEYDKIKKSWTAAWKELRALEAFEKD